MVTTRKKMGRAGSHKGAISRMARHEYSFKVIKPTTPLRHDVTESIRTAIAVGRFASGERMRERDLCEMTGVSRTLVREALRQLESEGVIEVVAHRGPVVAVITEEQARGIYQVREVLEGLAAELYARNASDDSKDELRETLQDMREAFKSDDPIRWLEAKNQFYDCIMRGAGNDALGRSLSLLNARAILLRARSMKTPGRLNVSYREIEKLVDALVTGTPSQARKVAVSHVREAGKIVFASFRETEKSRQKPGKSSES